MLLRQNAFVLPRSAFDLRKRFLQTAFQKGEYLRDPENRGAPPANPLTDPGGMDAMMNMMKSNMVMFIPQTVIMGWINFFFSGFVLCIFTPVVTSLCARYVVVAPVVLLSPCCSFAFAFLRCLWF